MYSSYIQTYIFIMHNFNCVIVHETEILFRCDTYFQLDQPNKGDANKQTHLSIKYKLLKFSCHFK